MWQLPSALPPSSESPSAALGRSPSCLHTRGPTCAPSPASSSVSPAALGPHFCHMCGAEYGHLHCVLTAIGQLLSLPPSTSYFFHLGLHKQPLTSPGFPDTPCWLRSRTCACADPLSGGPTLPSSPGQPLSGLHAHSSHEPSHALADPVRGPLASTPQLYPVPPALCGRTRKGVCTAASRACPALASTDEGLPGGLSELCMKFHLQRPVYSYK